MTENHFHFSKGSRCRLSELGIAKSRTGIMKTGTIVGSGHYTDSIRIVFDGSTTPVSLHKKYIELISAKPEQA
jgi:hypothetical protein